MLQIPRWQIVGILVILLLGLIFASPNLLPKSDDPDSLPGWVPHKQISLGLDLQGGSYLLVEVDFDGVLQEQREDWVGAMRVALRGASILYKDLGVKGGRASFEILDPAQSDEARDLVRQTLGNLELDVDDDVRFSIGLDEQMLAQRQTAILNQTLEVIRGRIDETGTREPTIQRHGSDRILIQLPGVDDPERIKALIGTTARLTFQFVEESANPNGPAPPGAEIFESQDLGPTGLPVSYVVSKRVMVKGESLTDAQATFQDAQPVVSFTFDTEGAKRFADATKANVGRLFAIILDEKVISAPVIREPILGGSGIISGNFTSQSASDLALLLRAGALPADLTFLEERTVGPGLGADSIRAGKIASALGMVFVIAFMIASYGTFGAFANVALIANLILIAAVLSGLQATLTLPGIAGIVLTIGMAVDANVLIFERIREETLVNGRSAVTAIDAGYRRAMTTIIDSNLTTLIAAILLFQFGSGPIKGFAVTLAIGLVTSMFTAIMLTRLLVVTWLRRRRPQALAF